MLKKESFQWSEEAVAAFRALKEAITSALVLVLPDFSQDFIIESDASGGGLGVVLITQLWPRIVASWAFDSKLVKIIHDLSCEQTEQICSFPQLETSLYNFECGPTYYGWFFFGLHRLPQSIVSDRDVIFLSKFWQEFFKLQQVNLHMSSAYHTQSDTKRRL
ncbi:PREDICTED: uncharacterized protein LOC109217076 [Nicotiana attenuata]|uniref:uncharacterized protein LOC109217076 n=1 Tax=Nicotiana attenuata TaxID=49451 RepID=UPI00090588E0|nr:PREDICTED: uncharacterized protein LOC109217076 [Nicotiana attenuata]